VTVRLKPDAAYRLLPSRLSVVASAFRTSLLPALRVQPCSYARNGLARVVQCRFSGLDSSACDEPALQCLIETRYLELEKLTRPFVFGQRLSQLS